MATETSGAFDASPIWQDVKKIFDNGSKVSRYELRVKIHTVDDDIDVLKVVSFDVRRDYHNNIADQINLELLMPLGDYVKRVYPNKTNLEVSLKALELDEKEKTVSAQSSIAVKRYKAVFIPDQNTHPASSDLDRADIDSLSSNHVTVRFQLLDRSLEPLKIKTTWGVFNNVGVKDVLVGLLGHESQQVIVDGKAAIDGVDIVAPDNDQKRMNLVIPQGTPVLKLARYMQEKEGGVYTGDINTYLQSFNKKTLWFIYPLYRSLRFDSDAGSKVVIYHLPNERFPTVDVSYFVDGDVLRIACTGQKRYQDTADVDYMNDGVGFQALDQRVLMKKPVRLTQEGAVMDRTATNYEVATTERADGLNYARAQGSTANPYVEYSKVAKRNFARIDLTWSHSNIDLLHPAMPVMYVFMDGEKMVQLKGTLVLAQEAMTVLGASVTDKIYERHAGLVLLVEEKPAGVKPKAYKDFSLF